MTLLAAILSLSLAVGQTPGRATRAIDDPKDYRVLGADKKRVAIVNANCS